MRKVKIPIDAVVILFPEISNIGNLPRKKKKQMKKDIKKTFMKKFDEWLENKKPSIIENP